VPHRTSDSSELSSELKAALISPPLAFSSSSLDLGFVSSGSFVWAV